MRSLWFFFLVRALLRRSPRHFGDPVVFIDELPFHIARVGQGTPPAGLQVSERPARVFERDKLFAAHHESAGFRAWHRVGVISWICRRYRMPTPRMPSAISAFSRAKRA